MGALHELETAMNHVRLISVLAALGLTGAAYGQDQNQNPPKESGSTDPSAASSPHQRDVAAPESTEAPTTSSPEPGAASTPHQQEVLKGGAAMAGKASTGPMFVQTAAQDGMTEVALGKVVAKNSSNSAVKAFAERMVADHGKANTELAGIAERKHLTVPKDLDAKHRAMVAELSGKSGAAFDATYAQHMVDAHANAIALFTEASKLPDAELAGFAKKTLPTLREHKKMADDLASGHAAM